MSVVAIAMAVCLLALLILLWVVRRDKLSLGLPVAYMLGLLLIHLPGAWASLSTRGIYGGLPVEYGFLLTTVGVICFVVGVALAKPLVDAWERRPASVARAQKLAAAAQHEPPWVRREFWLFCLFGGWLLVYGFSFVLRLPSIGAAVEKGGAIWMLGVMMGLAYALDRRAFAQAALWGSALAVYPVFMLILGGFLSYGSATVMIVGSFLTITARRYWQPALAIFIAGFIGISVFVNYFAVRTDLRNAVWGGQSIAARMTVMTRMVTEFKWFDPSNPAHLNALDMRLNQNYFVGLAADRLDRGQIDYLNGQSLRDGLYALVPRVLWPQKPTFAGSGDFVRDVTGLDLDRNTSWGVGNVLEFYMNFGRIGLVLGFLILGVVLGVLDRRAALAITRSDYGRSTVYFLPAAALIQPNGSLVELAGGGAAALVAGFFWQWAWRRWSLRRARRHAFGAPSQLRP